MKKYIFLDRDGVINKNPPYGDYIRRAADFKFLPHVTKAIKLLTEAGFTSVIISNQSGIGKGLFTKTDLIKIDAKMLKGVKTKGGSLSGTYYCIHPTTVNCDCKKPKTGLLKKAVGKNKVDFRKSFFIGDTERDTVAGTTFGVKTIAVLSGYAKRKDIKKWKIQPDYIADDLYSAVKDIVLERGTK